MKNICITIHHEGTFAYDPLSYEYGDVEVVENVNLENCNYERLMKIVKECCLFPVHAYDNGCKVELYVEHHGYDVMADGQVEMELLDGFSYLVYNPNLPWNEKAPLLGMKFGHPDQLNDCLINYEVANGYQLWAKQRAVEYKDYASQFYSNNNGSHDQESSRICIGCLIPKCDIIHRKCLAGFAGVREVLSTTGRSQKQWVGIGRIQFDVEDDQDMF
ncbi:hypothetical protein Tco_0270738 [Tanacetum coccineum]